MVSSLTTLRGVLAGWVVCYHFWNDLLVLFPTIGFFTPLARQGHFAVPVFFVLSGFVLAHNYAEELSRLSWQKYGRFVFLRLVRIYPVHLFTLLIVLAMVMVSIARGWSISDTGYGATDFVLNLLLVHTWVPDFRLNWNYPSWSISSEWFAYLWFPLLCVAVLPRIRTRARARVFLAATWLATIGLYALVGDLPYRELVRVIPTFLAGTAIFACLRGAPRSRQAELRFVPDVLLLLLAVVPGLTDGPLMMALLLSGFVSLVYLLVYQGDWCTAVWTSRFPLYLGEISYSLYMSHTLAQKVCSKLLPAERFRDSGATSLLAILLAYLLLIAAFTLGTYYGVERPVRRRLRRVAGVPAESTPR